MSDFAERSMGESQKVLMDRFRDPTYLPSSKKILDAFGQKDFYAFCINSKHPPIYEFLNREFITALADYLAERVELLGGTKEGPLTILEVGAGDGRLTHFLSQALEGKIPSKFRIIASDNLSWKIQSLFPVEKKNYKEAVEEYNPDMVICSWMPANQDWTPTFRAEGKCQEYILIGANDGRVCGTDEAWGEPPLGADFKAFHPQYEKDGFVKVYLDEIKEHQISHMDNIRLSKRTGFPLIKHSQTISFRRE